ncbi:MFS transporter [Stackebrandtia nassauensis]|uniref:Major facilitator superfamily MFS_1 n=1 Tax=Stackebrandtia nassauensis (strain DSM 44728 / CIP 108903 / NRRL B-16338 / NBRC 102104 / LLR-40K-21) TaxID=446470 RepID=D3PUL6_STANL|nr:MFS transporter [Stackebrandtia nassauensis]ADD43029.1 major facilitator superfamily MFS_1 [Stackebrandtia nassauensis DSM 44728]
MTASPRRFAATSVAFAFWICMAGTTVPTALYPLYQNEFSFSAPMVTVIFAVYAAGVVCGLLVFGRLADQIGRKPTMLIALTLSLAAAAVFLLATGTTMLLIGRVLSGLSAALITGAATAALSELIPPDGPIRSASVALWANMGGLAGGAFLASAIADGTSQPLLTPWWATAALALLASLALWPLPETARARSRFAMQKLHFPSEIRADFTRSAATASAGFAVLGVLTALTGKFLHTVVPDAGHWVTGAMVATAFLSTALGQFLARALPSGFRLPAACLGLIAAAALVGTAVSLTSWPLLLCGAATVGLSTGIAMAFGLSAITTRSRPEHRGASVSTFFAILYTMLALPAVGVGLVTQATSLPVAARTLSTVVAAGAAVVLFSLLWSQRDAEPARVGGRE